MQVPKAHLSPLKKILLSKYPEIEALKQYYKDFSIQVTKLEREGNRPDAFWVNFSINKNSWDIFIDDEYQHFNENKPVINLYLTLDALEAYKESDDFLVWCKEQFLEVSNTKWLEYYKSLEIIYKEIELVLGAIDSKVSCYDYSLQTGLGKALVNAR